MKMYKITYILAAIFVIGLVVLFWPNERYPFLKTTILSII